MKRELIPTMVLFLAAMNSPTTLTAEARSLSGEEEHFVLEAASGGLAEVKLSELAKNRASDAKVKDFANQMIIDHTQANDELKPIADYNKIAWPDRLEGDSDTAFKQLTKLSGPNFDEEYIKVMVKDHDKTVRDFEDASHKIKDTTIKDYINKTLPILRQHQRHAHELAKENKREA
jgi:putative membrane protein